MERKGILEESLKRAFEAHEAPVKPELWAGIQTQVAAHAAASSGAASVATSSGVFTKVAAVGIISLMTVATISEVRYQTAASEEGTPNVEQAAIAVQEINTEAAEKLEALPIEEKETTTEIATATPDNRASENTISYEEATGESSVADVQIMDQEAGDVNIVTDDASDDVNADTRPSIVAADSDIKPTSATDQTDTQPSTDDQSSQGNTEERRPELTHTAETLPLYQEPEEEPKTIAEFTHKAIVPLTPNGDGMNDYFEVEGFDVDQFEIIIYNRWKQSVFESSDINFRWNGRDRMNNALPAGVYFFRITATGTDGLPYKEQNSRGSIEIF